MQKYDDDNNKKEESAVKPIGEEREGEKRSERERGRESQMSSWNDVPHSPCLHFPKYLVLKM